jgi:hypothetical protein
VTHSTLVDLQRKNADLRQLVIRLSTIILRNMIEQRELVGLLGDEVAPRMLALMTPAAVVSRLREVSIRCTELSRGRCESSVAHAFEGLSVELAAEAEALEEILKIPGGLEMH